MPETRTAAAAAAAAAAAVAAAVAAVAVAAVATSGVSVSGTSRECRMGTATHRISCAIRHADERASMQHNDSLVHAQPHAK